MKQAQPDSPHSYAPKVYFSVVVPENCGLSDSLHGYLSLRKLGFLLGFTYCHTRLLSQRRFSFEVKLRNLLGGLQGKWAFLANSALRATSSRVVNEIKLGIQRRCPSLAKILGEFDENAFDFLGINAHFTADKTLPGITDFPKELRYRIALSGRLIRENNLSTYDELARYIKAFVDKRKKPHQPLLLILEKQYSYPRLDEILPTTPMSLDPLDLRTIYFGQRKAWPQKSHFPNERLKITAHLRLGDRAAFRTPWGTWMAHFPTRLSETGESSHNRYTLLKTPGNNWIETSDEQGFLQLTPTDFHQFMRDLMLHLPPDSASVQLFSDGMVRTTRDRLLWNITERRAPFSLHREVRKLMGKSLNLEQRQLKSLFKSLPDGTCCIGEAPGQLFRLIHAVIESDVVIAAYPLQQNFISSLIPLYTTPATMPLVLLLHKPGGIRYIKKPVYQGINLLSRAIFVDISAPDFPMLAERILTSSKDTSPKQACLKSTT